MREVIEVEEIRTTAGTFVVFHRDNDRCDEAGRMQCQCEGPGKWHWATKGGDPHPYGHETAEDAKNVMWSHVWALMESYRWP